MTLPRLLVLTDRSQLPPGRGLTEQVGRALQAGLRAVVLRERDLPDDERSRCAREIARLLKPVDGVLVAASPSLPGVTGVHLRSTDTLSADRPALLGRSCHSPDELAQARDDRVDYVTLGPVAPSVSKPGYGPALGRDGLHHLLTGHTGPAVYALGGVTADNASEWRRAGAHGVAVMGEVMRAYDPAPIIDRLLDRVETA